MSDSEFLEFRQKHAEEIIELEGFVSAPPADDPISVLHRMNQATAKLGRAYVLLGWAESFYRKAKAHRLVAKSKEWTELDREIEVNAATADERRMRDILKGYTETLKSIASTSQSALKFMEEERRGLTRST